MELKPMVELVDKLNLYTDAYNRGEPLISDKEWDELYFKLEAMENHYDVFLEDSPTQTVHFSSTPLNKIEHSHPMLSLAKTKELSEIRDFIGDKDSIAMLKMDGLTLSLHYANGYLIGAETRGNGYIGEDVTRNIFHVENIPFIIPNKDDIIIDGELIMTYDDFYSYNEKNGNKYKNPRNLAAGIIRRQNPHELKIGRAHV